HSRVVARPAVHGDGVQVRVRHAESGAGEATVGDVVVELLVSRAEALTVLFATEDGKPVAHEQRAGLEEIAARTLVEFVARGDARLAALDVHTGPDAIERSGERDVPAQDAARADLAQRGPARAG